MNNILTRSGLKALKIKFSILSNSTTNTSTTLNNHCSTPLKKKKENYSTLLTNNSYKTIKNLFSIKYYSTSANLSNNNIKLEPKLFEKWTSKQVCSLLCSSKDQGGAGLSRTKVLPLYNAGFDGLSIYNIIHTIKTKDEFIAIEQLQTIYQKSGITLTVELLTTLQSVVIWVNNLLETRLYHLWSFEHAGKQLCGPISKGGMLKSEFNQLTFPLEYCFDDRFMIWKENYKISFTPIFTKPDSIISARIDSQFNYLRDLTRNSKKWNELEAMIGTNIPLPIFGSSEYVPKDYNPKLPYLLTRQGFEILKKVVNREEEGYVLSGPYGISKSYIMYLLASYAIVNSIPLLYVPKCRLWVREYEKHGHVMADKYLKSLVLYWNSDIFTDDQIDQIEQTGNIISYLSYHVACEQPCFYLFDEHDEWFKSDTEDNYLEDFSGRTTGDYTMTVYCGSAHSLFEDRLSSRAQSKIIRIIPPTFNEFKVLIQNFGFTNLSEEKLLKIDFGIGRIPNEVKLFAKHVNYSNDVTDEQIRSFVEKRQYVYKKRIDKLVENSNIEQIQEFETTVQNLFSFDKYFNGRGVPISGPFYDTGLFYKNSTGCLFPINEASKKALYEFYVNR